MLWKENIQEFMKRIRQRPVRSGGSGQTDRMMWVVRSDKGGDGWMKMGTNPDITPPSKVQCPDALAVKGMVLVGECGGTWQPLRTSNVSGGSPFIFFNSIAFPTH